MLRFAGAGATDNGEFLYYVMMFIKGGIFWVKLSLISFVCSKHPPPRSVSFTEFLHVHIYSTYSRARIIVREFQAVCRRIFLFFIPERERERVLILVCVGYM